MVRIFICCNLRDIAQNPLKGFGNWSGLGFIGSPTATSISRTLQLIAFVLYTCSWKKLHVKTWPTEPFWQCLSRNIFSEYMRQTFPTMIGNAAEQWVIAFVLVEFLCIYIAAANGSSYFDGCQLR